MQSYGDEKRTVAALSLPSRIVVAVATGGVAVVAAVHLAMMFLHVAPANTITKLHGEAVDDYVYPEYEQNWKLFAPDPLQQNIAVQARAEIRPESGGASVVTTGWTDLTAADGRAIHHNLLPSHTQQNALRRAWEFFLGSHDARNRPSGQRGELSERYLQRIVLARLGPRWAERGVVDRVQLRSVSTPVAPPRWSPDPRDHKPVHRVLPWWPVTTDDLPEGTRNP